MSRRQSALIGLFLLAAALLLLPRLPAILTYNLGHRYLVAYTLAETPDTADLTAANRAFARLEDQIAERPEVAWRLSHILFLLGEYDAAAALFDQQSIADHLSAPLQEGIVAHHMAANEYWVLAALSRTAEAPAEAVTYFRRALAVEPREWDRDLYRSYYAALSQSTDAVQKQVGERLLLLLDRDELTPGELDEWLTAELPLENDALESSCPRLAAIRYDEEALAQGPLVPVELLWRAMDQSEPAQHETTIVVNLAPNAGFEWGQENGQPFGFPGTIYREDDPDANHHLSMDERNGKTSTVAELQNSSDHPQSSYVSRPVEVAGDGIYFQGGWIAADGGRAALGHNWRHLRREVERPYQYAAEGVRDPQWRYYGQELAMHPRAETAELWLLNLADEGSARFDDLLFFRVPAAACN